MLKRTVAACSILFALAGGSLASDLRTCVAQVAEIDLGAKLAFQTGMRDLIIAQGPQFKELAGINWELQTALARSRNRRLQHLLSTDATRLDVSGSLSRLTNFDWSASDTAELARLDASFKALEDEITELTARNNGHADWPALRELVATKLSQNADYQALMTKLRQGRDTASVHLQSCK